MNAEQTTDKTIKQTRIVAMIVVLITSFTMSLTGSALNLSIPNISSEFNVEAGLVGWIVTCYMLTVAALSVPFGRWSDISDRKKVISIGIAVFIAGCAGGMFATGIKMLLGMRVLQGIGGAMVLSSNMPILMNAYPPQERGKAIGYSVGSTYVGLSLGPVIGGILNNQLGWRSIFFFAGALTVIALITCIAKLPAQPSPCKTRSQDLPGSILYIIFIVLFMLGLSNVSGGVIYLIIIAAGLLFGVLFVRRELTTDDPALNISLFRNNVGYTLSNLAALMNYAATFATGYLMSIYLQVVLGYSSETAGIILIIQPVIMAILTPKMGRVSDRRSPFKMASLGMAICALGIAFFIFLKEDTSLAFVIIALIIVGLGFAFFSSPNTNAIMSCVNHSDYGIATSVLNTMRTIGQTTSMVIVTIIVSITMPGLELNQAEPAVLVQVIHIAFIIFVCMCVVGVFISLKRKK